MTEMNMVQALNSAMDNEMRDDNTVIILGEDVGIDGGVFRVTDGLFKKYKGRVIDTPLAESAIVGTSIGMAMSGLKPVAEIQFSGFIAPGFDQLISHAARMRTRSYGEFNVPMVVRAPCQGGVRALEHHSESTEAIYAHIPGLKVVMPSTPYDAKGLLISSIRDPNPVLFLEPKRLYRSIKQEVPEDSYTVPLGKAAVIKEGTDVTIITWGTMTRPSLKAANYMSKLNGKVSCEVIDLRTISPLDHETIVESVKKTGRYVVVQEAPRSFGVASEVMAVINDKAFYSLKSQPQRVTGMDTPMPGFSNENYYIPNTDRVVKAIQKVMEE